MLCREANKPLVLSEEVKLSLRKWVRNKADVVIYATVNSFIDKPHVMISIVAGEGTIYIVKSQYHPSSSKAIR